MTTGARKGAVEWYGIGLIGGPEGSPDGEGSSERFTVRKTSKSPTNENAAGAVGEESEPEINMTARKNGPRDVIAEKGSLHSLGSPEEGEAGPNKRNWRERQADLEREDFFNYPDGDES
jgi:hypothetical protein